MKILIIKMSSLGDLFHALPAVHNLKEGLNADVDWVTHEKYADLVRCFSDVDRVIPFHRNDFLSKLGPFLKELRKDEYDYVIDLQGLLKSALVTVLARGKKKIGPSFHREGAGLFYSDVAGKRDKNRHAVEENLDIVRFLGLKPVDPVFPTVFPEPEDGLRPSTEGRIVALLPSSRWETKNWPAKCFVDVGKRLRERSYVSFVVLGGPDDAALCAEIADGIGKDAVNCAGKCSLAETGGLLKKADLLISNDSGPVHMAAALGTKTLVVFGPTEAKRTGPYGEGHRVVTADNVPCRPCFSRTCHVDGIPCLTGVTPEHVAEIAAEMLG